MTTETGLSSCCLSGKLKEGQPVGREETIGGISTYVSEPSGGSKSKAVVFITDSMFALTHIEFYNSCHPFNLIST